MTVAARDRPRHGLLALATLVVILGLAAARIGYAPFEFQQALQSLITGLFVALMGLVATDGAPWSRVGPLLVLTAVAWYLPALRWVAADVISEAARGVSLLWVGVLGQALLTYPSGRIARPMVGACVGLVYIVALIPSDSPEAFLAVALGLAIVATAIRGGRTSWHERRVAVVTGLAFCLALGSYRWLAGRVLLVGPIDPRPIAGAALMATAAILGITLLRRAAGRARVTDLVVDLGGSTRGGLAGALGEAIGDPSLQVGLWLPAESRYVDSAGRPFEAPGPGSDRSMTPIADAGRPVAILVHDRTTAADPALASAIARAAELSAANAALQLEIRSQVEAVRASRGRLLSAGDEARRSIELRLRESLQPMLLRIGAALEPLGSDDPQVQAIAGELAETRTDLAELAEGVHPRLLDDRGLKGAIAALAARCDVPVETVVLITSEPDSAIQVSLLFVVGEALANVVKHAAATHVRLELTDSPAGLRLDIEDNGIGGARPAEGTGLMGLRDRVEAVSGHLVVTSAAGAGTHLVALLPHAVPGPGPGPGEGGSHRARQIA
jgi:hypothetical protein